MQYDGPALILCVLILCLSYTSYLLLQAIHFIIIINKNNIIFNNNINNIKKENNNNNINN